MDNNFVPSLQFLVYVKIAILLWTKRNIEERVSKFSFEQCRDEAAIKVSWREIKDQVAAHVPKLPLPVLLKNELLLTICALSSQLYFYAKQHLKWGKLHVKQIHWTHEGTVDRRKSIQGYISNEKSYSLLLHAASCNCLVDDFDDFWKKKLLDWIPLAITDVDLISTVFQKRILSYWRNRIMVEMGQTPPAETNVSRISVRVMFRLSVEKGNESACRYFFKLLNKSEKGELLVKMAHEAAYLRSNAPPHDYSDIFFFLLSQMNAQQKMEVFSSKRSWVLSCFLDWPRQQYFSQVYECLLNVLSGQDCIYVMREILTKVVRGYNDYSYSYLLHEVAKYSTSTQKTCIVSICARENVLISELIEMNATKVLSALLFYATQDQKKQMFLNLEKTNFCICLARKSLWDSVFTFMNLFVTSKLGLEEMLKLRDKVKANISKYCYSSGAKRRDPAMCRLYSMLDERMNAEMQNLV